MDVRALDAHSADELRRLVEHTFATASSSSPLWERLSDSSSIQSERGWKTACRLVGDSKTILFCDRNNTPGMWSVRNGRDLEALLGKCVGINFYLTNETAEYLLAFNDHDYLIAAGAASAWLDAIGDEAD